MAHAIIEAGAMLISEFDYDLPAELIARGPAHPRDASRMMVLDSSSGRTSNSTFNALPEFLHPTDVVVLNDTKVIRARTEARLERSTGTARQIEVFFAEPLRESTGNLWHVLCKPGRRIRPGDRAIFASGEMTGVFQESLGGDLHVLELQSSEPISEILERYGRIPLPPYIDRAESTADEKDYQTVFAARAGAVAAPTAGLHFTEESIAAIRARGITVATITLHVGIGTFLPIRTQRAEDHVLRPERFEISQSTAELLNSAVHERRRIVAVGTTTTRTLEYMIREYREIRPGSGKTDLYILPGFQFRITGALLTNFHLPRSTLLMLVSAFAGRDAIRSAYEMAIKERYRFYSYGDCMLILK
jgi:S-adenosylmethionine:tRNA ribosyltransferase-isomerase